MTRTELAELLQGPVMSVSEASRVMRTSQSDVRNRVRTHELESVRVGRRVLVRTQSVKRLLGIDEHTSGDAA